MAQLIQVENLGKVYRMGENAVHALREVTLEIASGEFVAIMGPSGSGKSTFMNILGCLDRPTSGHYWLEGVDVGRLDRDQLAEIRNRKIGFVFQSYQLLARTSALENVALPLLYGSVPPAAHEARSRAALRAVAMEQRAHHLPNQLSGGQQQRVAIARALVTGPSIIMADEPTGALDSRTSVEIMAILQRLNGEQGLTVLVVTHEADIAQYAGRIIGFKDGAVVRATNRRAVHRRAALDPRPAGASRRKGSTSLLRSSIRIALRALRVNKMRSALTMLGVIIGVGAVIAMVAVGKAQPNALSNRSPASAAMSVNRAFVRKHHHFRNPVAAAAATDRKTQRCWRRS
ncbi:MAG: ATP-binding cassette domain-containing protein [Bryobacteraceae bacterium]